MEDYNLKKSCLRNTHVKAVRALEKKIKKSKGVQRQQQEKELTQMLEQHDRELEELKMAYNIQTKPIEHHPQSEEVNQSTNDHEIVNESHTKVEEKDWSSLSTKELRNEATLRHLGKKGNREALVTKLVLFHNDQRRQMENEKDHSMVPDTSNGDLSTTLNAPHSSSSTSSKHRAHHVNETVGRKATDRPALHHDSSESAEDSESEDDDESEDGKKESVHPTYTESSEGDTSDSQKEADDDIPDVQKLLGGSKQDTRGNDKRMCASSTRQNNPRKDQRRKSEANATVHSTLTNEQRQKKREKVMQKVLLTLTKKFPKGLALNDIPTELQALNVSNFRPALCGYTSLHEWIVHQPSTVVSYNERTQRIFPPSVLG